MSRSWAKGGREVRSGQSAFPQSPAGISPWTRKSLPSWPQCCAPCMPVKTVTVFQQSHQTKFLKSRKNREPRMESTAEPWVLEQSAGLGHTALPDFHRNRLLLWRKGYLASTGLHCSVTLFYCEWSDCASVSTGCPKMGHRRICGFFAANEDLVGRGKGTRWSMRQMVMEMSGCHSTWLLTLK